MKTDQEHTSFLPDFCTTRIVYVVLLLAELLAIILTLVRYPDSSNSPMDLAMYSLFIQWIALSSVATLCVCRPYLNHLQDYWVAGLSYCITLLISLVITELAWRLVYKGMNDASHGIFFVRCMGISAIVCALVLRYFYVRHQWRLQIKSEAEARFQALQSRIRPHFLFNCMNTIASLTRSQPQLAEQAIEDLSDLFRASLRDSQSGATLKDEISLCKRYLRIEKHRLGERLNVHWEIDTLPMETRIPALLLQPLLENAIVHGIECLPEGGTINIHGVIEDQTLHLTITNPVPVGRKYSQYEGHHLAQENIRQRLHALHDQQDLLRVELDSGEYRVILTLPLSHEDTDR
jgi:two-component system sensor histidine kinase AlgZ